MQGFHKMLGNAKTTLFRTEPCSKADDDALVRSSDRALGMQKLERLGLVALALPVPPSSDVPARTFWQSNLLRSKAKSDLTSCIHTASVLTQGGSASGICKTCPMGHQLGCLSTLWGHPLVHHLSRPAKGFSWSLRPQRPLIGVP